MGTDVLFFDENRLRKSGYVDPRTVLSPVTWGGPRENIPIELRRLGYQHHFQLTYSEALNLSTSQIAHLGTQRCENHWTAVWVESNVIMAFENAIDAATIRLCL